MSPTEIDDPRSPLLVEHYRQFTEVCYQQAGQMYARVPSGYTLMIKCFGLLMVGLLLHERMEGPNESPLVNTLTTLSIGMSSTMILSSLTTDLYRNRFLDHRRWRDFIGQLSDAGIFLSSLRFVYHFHTTLQAWEETIHPFFRRLAEMGLSVVAFYGLVLSDRREWQGDPMRSAVPYHTRTDQKRQLPR